MREIVLDLTNIEDTEQLHRQLAETLAFPSWYGANLDALYDCLTDTTDELLLWIRMPEGFRDPDDACAQTAASDRNTTDGKTSASAEDPSPGNAMLSYLQRVWRVISDAAAECPHLHAALSEPRMSHSSFSENVAASLFESDANDTSSWD